MKFSYQWLASHLDGLAVPPAEIGKLITMKTAECEGVEAVGAHFAHVVIARILTSEAIPETHLHRTTVDTGRYGVLQVVCGAKNCRAGLLTAYVPPGWLGVTSAVLRGVASEGMLASASELGLGSDHEGILELAEGTPGDPLPGCVADTVVEIDNKSLTHRPDLWGHFGMAREVAAISGARLKDPVDLAQLPQGAPAIEVAIADPFLCPRFSALRFENVTVGPSPLWLRQRLAAVGLNPINNIVDVTNFLMAELAQPMHAYDAAKLTGNRLTARPAAEGELCPALNNQTYTLDPSVLVIADEAGPVGIAGIIGGGPSSITEATTAIVLEAANFNGGSIRKTSTRLKLRTDASMRFEKSQDPVNTTRALARAIGLLKLVSPGIRVVGGLADLYHPLPAVAPIVFELGWMRRKLGLPEIPGDEVARILTSLEFGVTRSGETFTVAVPSWRATKDISIKDDLVEEVGRMIGYGSITPIPPQVPATVPPLEPERAYLRELRASLTAQGYTESYNYSFLSEAQAAEFDLPLSDHIRVLNPIAQGQELLRTSLLPNLKRNIADNAREFESFRMFEIGREIHKREGALPDEVPHLAAAVYARHGDGAASLFELKRLATTLLEGAAARPSAEPRSYEHPARTAEIVWQGEVVGRLFELHPRLLDTGRVAILDLDLRLIQSITPGWRRYRPLRRFPTSAFDLSVVTGARTLAADVQAVCAAAAGPHSLGVQYLYAYTGEKLGEGRKSLTFRTTLGADDRTLTGAEAGAVRAGIIAALEAAGYTVQA